MAAGRVETPLAFAPDHPAFEGHFPGTPILPGVAILAEVLAAIEAATARGPQEWEVSNAKFLVPVGPGTALTLIHQATETGGVRFEVRSPEALVASGLLARRKP